MANKIKERAERNGKIRRTVSQIEQTISKLEQLKDEYLQKAADAKSRGEQASYSLCKSALNTTLTQIKRAKEMLLNIQITSELQKMGETNADFLTGMSVVAKRISKINKQSDFVKLQKEIEKALCGMEEAQAGLDVFLNSADAHFAAISQTSGALSDRQIDALISGRATEREIMMDARLDAVMNAPTEAVPAPEREKTAAVDGGPDVRPAAAVAKPFPSPRGAFEFAKGSGVSASSELFGDDGEPSLKSVFVKKAEPAILLKATTGETLRVRLSESPVLVCGAIGCGKSALLHGAICSLVSSFTAAELKLVLFDFNSEELVTYNGIAHAAADAVTCAEGALPALDALAAETSRRLDVMNGVGATDICNYNAAADKKLPYIVVVFDEYSDAMRVDGFERALLRQMRTGAAAGVYYILATRNTDEKTLTPGILGAAKSRAVFRTSDAAACSALGADEARELVEAGELVYIGADGSKTLCRAPYISTVGVNAVCNALKENVI